MAQIMLTFMDSNNGSITSFCKLTDKDLQRVYDAFRYKHAENILHHKKVNEEILEAGDTVENISNQIPSQEVIDNLFVTFIDRLISDAHNIESKKVLTEFYNKLNYIKILE